MLPECRFPYCLATLFSECDVLPGRQRSSPHATDTCFRDPFFRCFFIYFCLFFLPAFCDPVWSTGRPKRSIVTNLAPKTTPKWSPKRSRIANGRPSRNVGRHCPNTYFALSWELRFRCFFGVCKKVTKKLIKNDRVRNLVPTGPQMESQRAVPG